MKVIEHSKNGITLFLSNDEILIVNNALNEIVNGMEISEFETRIGFSEETVKESSPIFTSFWRQATLFDKTIFVQSAITRRPTLRAVEFGLLVLFDDEFDALFDKQKRANRFESKLSYSSKFPISYQFRINSLSKARCWCSILLKTSLR